MVVSAWATDTGKTFWIPLFFEWYEKFKGRGRKQQENQSTEQKQNSIAATSSNTNAAVSRQQSTRKISSVNSTPGVEMATQISTQISVVSSGENLIPLDPAALQVFTTRNALIFSG